MTGGERLQHVALAGMRLSGDLVQGVWTRLPACQGLLYASNIRNFACH